MFLSMDSTFKRALFIAIVIAINVILAYTVFFYLPTLNQKAIFIYLGIIQILVIGTFFLYRDYISAKKILVKKLKNPRLQENAFEISKLLLEEYNYTKDTANQAMNDRHTMVNYFLLITGAVVSIVGSQLIKIDLPAISPLMKSILVALFIFLNAIGWIYFMHLIRLRQAWWSSAEAMNQIKEFFILNGRVPDDIARSAFLWHGRSIPQPGKKSNVFYYSTMLISFVSSGFILFASWLLTMTPEAYGLNFFTYFVAFYHLVFQMSCYSLFLDYRPIR